MADEGLSSLRQRLATSYRVSCETVAVFCDFDQWWEKAECRATFGCGRPKPSSDNLAGGHPDPVSEE